jgi:hypothetical protein
MNFTRDNDGTLCISPTKYIEKLIKNYEKSFGIKPKEFASPLEKGDHPEIDTLELCTTEQVAHYQSMIGSLQWIVTIGGFDIQTAVMTMSGFCIPPRIGHLERLRHIYGYLLKMRFASIRVRTEEPDYSDVPDHQYVWMYTVYGNTKEVLPKDAPEPLGKYVALSHYVDANLMHDVTTGNSVTGILHLINIIDLRSTLRYLGVPVREKNYMFGDNKSVVDSSMGLHVKLHKRHTTLSFHSVREAIASGIVGFYFIPGEMNPAEANIGVTLKLENN